MNRFLSILTSDLVLGLGRCQVYRSVKCTLKKYSNQTEDRIVGPSVDAETKEKIPKHEALDDDGIVAVGKQVTCGQVGILEKFKFSLILLFF